MIKLEHVNKYYNRRKKNEIHVINDTSLELKDNGLVALLGNSGCGKTTLLNAIGGLDKVNNGKIYVNGELLSKCSCKVDKIRNLNIGYIFQDYNLIDDMTVFENVAIALRLIGIKDKKTIKESVNYVLNKVGMYRYRNRYASMLSGGERQRVGIARAIVKNPNIIIADEPTGNLDSKNTIEVMNIIKAISKDKLVILVTHETELADFYASRIIYIEDGKIVDDKKNNHNNSLNYRLDNKIYLKDYKNHKVIENGKVKVNYFSNNEENININVIVENNNIYIENNGSKRVEIVDDSSSIEIVNEHYKDIDKSIYEEYDFDYNGLVSKSYKRKYSSIFNIFSLLSSGFKKVINYSVIKKILLLGFLASAMFITYSVSSFFALNTINEKDFIELNKNYLKVLKDKNSVSDYKMLLEDENINYVLPGNSVITLESKLNDYYQTRDFSANITGSLSSLEMIREEDIIYGNYPSNEFEIVVDKMILEDNEFFRYIGLLNLEDFIGREFQVENVGSYKIVGIVNINTPCIYTFNSQFINILYNTNSETNYSDVMKEIYDYELYEDNISLKKGDYPTSEYEVIIPYSMKDEYKIGKTINVKVNDEKLYVVGYYESNSTSSYLVNSDTIVDYLLDNEKGMVIYAKDKNAVIDNYKEIIKIEDSYEYYKELYKNERKDHVKASFIVSSIILAISLIEIYLMMRSSFLSRIKEVGVLRAIGVKKIDIYKLFIGEILSITSMFSLSGILLMSYILKEVSKINFLGGDLVINGYTILTTIVFVYLFNIVVGLLPVSIVVRKTPASILSRNDVQ